MKPVKFHSDAKHEMLDSAKYYEAKQKDLGKRFLEAVRSEIKKIQINPLIYAKITGNTRRCQTKNFPYGIIFRNKPDCIEIIAVMHFSRKPNYWKDRTLGFS